MSRFIDLTGQRFGRLTVVERAENCVTPCGSQKTKWMCRCDCGNLIEILGDNLRNGRTSSCGCMKPIKCGKKSTTHGKSNTRLYGVWRGMKARCYNTKNGKYRIYGGRGITICDEWLHDFQVFYEWAMNHGYCEGLSIDRIDNDKGYSPENCRWATDKEQSNNVRSNRCFKLSGGTKTLAEWCRHFNKIYGTVKYRLNHGWTIEEALDLVPRKK